MPSRLCEVGFGLGGRQWLFRGGTTWAPSMHFELHRQLTLRILAYLLRPGACMPALLPPAGGCHPHTIATPRISPPFSRGYLTASLPHACMHACFRVSPTARVQEDRAVVEYWPAGEVPTDNLCAQPPGMPRDAPWCWCAQAEGVSDLAVASAKTSTTVSFLCRAPSPKRASFCTKYLIQRTRHYTVYSYTRTTHC